MKLDIGGKIMVLALVLVLGTAGAVGWVFYKGTNSLLVRHELGSLEEELRLEALVHLVSGIKALEEDVLFLSAMPPVRGIIQAHRAGGIDPLDGSTEYQWHQRLETIFHQLLQAKRHYSHIRFVGVTSKGREIVRVNRVGDKTITIPEKDLQSQEHRDYFRKSIQLAKDDVYLSDITLDRKHGKVTEPHFPEIRAAVPIHTVGGEVFGVMVIDMDFGFALEQMRHERHLSYVTNDLGDFLLHPDPTRIFGFDFGKRYRITNIYPQLSGLFAPGNKEQGVSIPPQGEENDSVLHFIKVFFDPLNPERFLGLAWAASYQEVVAESTAIRNISILLTLLLMAGAAALAFVFSRRLVRPLHQITEATRGFADEVFDVPLPVNKQDETGVLARAFSTMIEKVNDRRDALQKTQEQSRSVVDHAMDGIITVDETGTTQSFNPSAERTFGYKAEEVIGKNIRLLMPEPYRSEHDRYIERYLHTGEARILGTARELSGLRKDGFIFPLEISISEFFQGDRRMFIGIVRDITGRKRAEEEIQSLSKFPDENPNPVIRVAKNGTLLYANKVCFEIFEADSFAIGKILPRQLLVLAVEAFTSNTTKRVEVELKNRNFWFTIRPVPEFDYVNLYGQDITDLKRAEKEVKILSKFPAENPYPILRIARDGRVLYGNIASQPLLQDWNCEAGQLAPERWRELIGEVFSENSIRTIEVKLKETIFSLVIAPVTEAGYANIYGGDITDRKRAEEEIKRYAEELEKANEELRDFTFTASHDLQEPLRKVITFGYRLETAWLGKQEEKGLSYIERMQHTAFRMRRLIEDLLEFSRTTGKVGVFQPVNLEEIVEEVVSDLEVQIEESKGGIKMGALPTLDADKSQMLQLFQNLISNGLKFVQPGQPPIVSLKSVSLPDGYWKILVEDNGIGFEEKYQDRIFKPFERLRTSEEYSGSGMGLAICNKIVSRHKGTITAESSANKGARFTITLPEKQKS